MHTSNPCIICNYIGNICNYMRKQLKPTAFQANMNQDFFFLFPSCSAALICPAEVRISHSHIKKKIPDLCQAVLRFFEQTILMFAILGVSVKPPFLTSAAFLFIYFWPIKKVADSTFLRHAHCILRLHLSPWWFCYGWFLPEKTNLHILYHIARLEVMHGLGMHILLRKSGVMWNII